MIRFITWGSACEPPAVLSTNLSTFVRMVNRGSGHHPAAQRFTGKVGARDADGVQEGQQMVDVVTNLQWVTGFIGVAVTQHVDRPCREVLGVRRQVADVCLSVTAGAVQQDQRRLALVAGMQVSSSHAAGIQVALDERDTLQIAPHALVLDHRFLSRRPSEIIFSSAVNGVC